MLNLNNNNSQLSQVIKKTRRGQSAQLSRHEQSQLKSGKYPEVLCGLQN